MGDRTVDELAGHHGVHPTLIQAWMEPLVRGAEEVLGSPARPDPSDAEARQAELFERTGRLERVLEWLEKSQGLSCESRRSLVDVGHPALSVRRQCVLLGLNRSSLYREPAGEPSEELRLIVEQYTAHPYYGSRRMTMSLIERG